METKQNPALAAMLMICASALIAVANLLAKALGTNALGPALHPLQVSQGRFMFALLAVGTVVAVMRPTFTAPQWRLHMGRTTCGWLGVTLMFAAAAQIPLSDAVAISFLNPIFTMMLAIPLLGERVGPIRWIAAAFALCGALVLLRPGAGSFQPGAVLALLSAMIIGLEIILIKWLSGMQRPLQVLLINNTMGTVIATTAMLFVWEPPTGAQWVALGGLGFAMISAQTFFVNAMARAEASFVVPFSYATLVFVTVYDTLIFGVLPDWVSVTGAVIILSGAALLAWREAVHRRRAA